jgi:CHASE1-domain containing sensor protein
MWWWIPVVVISVILAVGITFVGLVVFSEAANRRTWKDNLEDTYRLTRSKEE